MKNYDRLVIRVMKVFGVLGLVIAVGFAIILIMPFFDLQDEAVAISGLDAPALSIFNNVGNFAVFMVGIIAAIFLIGGILYMVKR